MSSELNTGMLMMRSGAGAMAVCRAWVARMNAEMVSINRLPASMLQWWSNDQTFFNEVAHTFTCTTTLHPPPAFHFAPAFTVAR